MCATRHLKVGKSKYRPFHHDTSDNYSSKIHPLRLSDPTNANVTEREYTQLQPVTKFQAEDRGISLNPRNFKL